MRNFRIPPIASIAAMLVSTVMVFGQQKAPAPAAKAAPGDLLKPATWKLTAPATFRASPSGVPSSASKSASERIPSTTRRSNAAA